MTDDKGAGEGPYTKVVCARRFNTGRRTWIFSGDGVSTVEITEPSFDSTELEIANIIYAEGRKAERERCADICEQNATCEGIAQKIKAHILGGQDGK